MNTQSKKPIKRKCPYCEEGFGEGKVINEQRFICRSPIIGGAVGTGIGCMVKTAAFHAAQNLSNMVANNQTRQDGEKKLYEFTCSCKKCRKKWREYL